MLKWKCTALAEDEGAEDSPKKDHKGVWREAAQVIQLLFSIPPSAKRRHSQRPPCSSGCMAFPELIPCLILPQHPQGLGSGLHNPQ